MGELDARTKKFMSDPIRFADLFNAKLYHGKQIIKASELRELDTATIVLPFKKGKKSIPIQKFRDIMKECVIKQGLDATYVLLGIENQSKIHYAMPVRAMLYNAMAYTTQVSDIINQHKAEHDVETEFLSGLTKDDKIKPVITITLYWGSEPWDAPRSLLDMLAPHDRRLDAFIDQSDINLISIIDDEIFEDCKSDLHDILKPLHYRNDDQEFADVMSSNIYSNMQKEPAELLAKLSGLKMPRKSSEGGYNMCKAVRTIKKDAWNEGANQMGKLYKVLIKDGRAKDFERAVDNEKYRAKLFVEYGLQDQKMA